MKKDEFGDDVISRTFFWIWGWCFVVPVLTLTILFHVGIAVLCGAVLGDMLGLWEFKP